MVFRFITNSVQKKLCQMMLERCIGKFLDDKLVLDQLSVNLYEGKLDIQGVSLNTDAVNKVLKELGSPLKLVDGYIGNISITVPWTSLMSEASKMIITELELTFEPSTPDFRYSREIASSMVASVIHSLVPPEDVARDVREEMKRSGEGEILEDDESLHSFAKIIDAVYSRFYVEIEKIAIRIERPPEELCPELFTALEIKIDKAIFVDGKTRDCDEKSEPNSSSTKDKPAGLGSISDLNKFVTLDGIQMYTDVYTDVNKTDETAPSTSSDVQSTPEKVQESPRKPEQFHTLMSEAFHSCYDTLSPQKFREEVIREPKTPLPRIKSQIVKFLEIPGRSTVVFRLVNATDSAENNLIEADILMDDVKVFVCPSQIAMLQKFAAIFETYASSRTIREDRPICLEMVRKIMREMVWARDAKKKQKTNINLSEESVEVDNDLEDDVQTGGDLMSLTASIVNLSIHVTHKDYLTYSYVESEGYETAVNELLIESNRFFGKQREPLTIRNKSKSEQYAKDHIRFLGSSISLSYEVRTTEKMKKTEARVVIPRCDVSEYLSKESAPDSNAPIRIPLLDFSKSPETNVAFYMIGYSGKLQNHIELYISQCKTEFDPSMIDRIADLIVMKPHFAEKIDPLSVPALEDDVNLLKFKNREKMVFSTNVVCPNWNVDLRIPKVDLREPESVRHPYTQRRVHEEFLSILVENLQVHIPRFKAEEPYLQRFEVTCEEFIVDFCGQNLNIPREQAKVLYGTTNGPFYPIEKIRCNIEIDSRDERSPMKTRRSLVLNDSHGVGEVMRRLLESRAHEGPFSKISQSFNGIGGVETILQAGSRIEMLQFMEECIKHTQLKVEVDIPTLRVHVPERQYLEVLYNRVTNLTLYQPIAPSVCYVEPKEYNFNIYQLSRDYDPKERTCEKTYLEPEVNRRKTHKLSSCIKVEECVILCETEVKENSVKTGNGKVAINLVDVNMGTTAGYHGNHKQSFFHVTAKNTRIGHSTIIANEIRHPDFGKWSTDEGQIDIIPEDDVDFYSKLSGDSLAVGIKVNGRKEGNAKDVLLCVAFRNSLIHARPIADIGQYWGTQLSELFTLEDYSVEGLEAPKVTTDLRFSIDNAVINYNHCLINPADDTILRAVIGSANISGSLSEMNLGSKAYCLLESCSLHIGNTARNDDFVKVASAGLMNFDVSISSSECNQIERMSPIFEVSFQNDVVSVDVCSDSLATLATIALEVSSSEKFTKKRQSTGSSGENSFEKCDDSSFEDASRNSSPSSEEENKRIMDLVADAVKDIDFGNVKVPDDVPKTDSFENLCNPDESQKSSEDEDFCFVDKDSLNVARGPTEVRIKHAKKPKGRDILVENHFEILDGSSETARSRKKPVPLFKHNLKNLSIEFSIYAGNDLQTKASPWKSFCSKKNETTTRKNYEENEEDKSGIYRDRSASVVVFMQEISLLREVFDRKNGRVARTDFDIGDVVIEDRVEASNINQMLHKHSTIEDPCRNAPFVSVKILETQDRDGEMRVSMLPFKINVDQDTLDFVTFFVEDTLARIRFPADYGKTAHHEYPVMGVPAPKPAAPKRSATMDQKMIEKGLESFSMVESFHPAIIDSNSYCERESYPNFLDGIDEEDEKMSRSPSCHSPFPDFEIFYKSFIFSPAVDIYVDYQGKRRVSSKEKMGKIVALLKAFGQLKNMPIHLSAIHHGNGLLGFQGCAQYALDEWAADMKKNMSHVLASYGPINNFVQLGRGVLDLFRLPVEEMRKENGRLITGIQNGVGSFGTSSAAGIVGLAQTFTGMVQTAAETAMREVSPRDGSGRKKSSVRRRMTNPKDIRHSLKVACKILQDGYHKTKNDLKNVREDQSPDKSVIQTAFRYAVPTFLAPIVMTTQITYQLLGGLRNQIQPDLYAGEQKKYGGGGGEEGEGPSGSGRKQ